MQIRHIAKADTAQFEKLSRDYYFGDRTRVLTRAMRTFDQPAPETPHPEVLPSALSNRSIITLVAEADGGTLVGFVSGKIYGTPDKALAKEGYISYLFVAKDHRGEDLGRKLIEKIEAEFRRRGYTHAAIEAFSTNQPAIDIYRHLGFTEDYIGLKKVLK